MSQDEEISQVFAGIQKSKSGDTKKKPKKSLTKKTKKKPPKLVKRKKPTEKEEDPTLYNISAECMTCATLKDNICSGTGSCYECDHKSDEVMAEVKKKLSELTPEEKSKMFDMSDEDLEKMSEKSKDTDSLELQIEDEAKEIAKVLAKETVAEPEEEEKKPKKPKKKRPPKPRKKKAPQISDDDIEKETEKEPEKPKKKIIKKSREKVEPLKAGIHTELELLNRLGADIVEFADPFENEEYIDKQTIVIVGRGKQGKSTLGLSAERGMFDTDNYPNPDECEHNNPTNGCPFCRPTITYAITMDDKTFKPAKKYMSDTRVIHVLRGMEHYREGTDALRLITSGLTQKYIDDLLLRWIPQHCKKNYEIDKPDFVLVDDLQILQNVYNHAMRQSFGFGVYDVFNWKNWTRRNQFVNETHRLANNLCGEALVYCTYEKWQDKKMEDGKEVSVKVPAWAGDIEKKTDTLIEASSMEGETMSFMAQVKSAKDTYWSYDKVKATTDFKGHGGLWNLLENAPIGKKFSAGGKSA